MFQFLSPWVMLHHNIYADVLWRPVNHVTLDSSHHETPTVRRPWPRKKRWSSKTSFAYEVRDLFPWKMFTKMVISCLPNVEKIWNSAQINLSSTLKFKLFPKICFRRNNIHWEIDQWNRRRFGAKWHVTCRPIVYKWIYMSQGLCCQMTHKLLVC